MRTFYYQAEYYEGQLKLQANKAVDFVSVHTRPP